MSGVMPPFSSTSPRNASVARSVIHCGIVYRLPSVISVATIGMSSLLRRCR